MHSYRSAVVLSATLLAFTATEVAHAWPSDGNSGGTVVKKTYRPLDLDLTLIPAYTSYESKLGFNGSDFLALTATFTGTFETSGASNPNGQSDSVSGNAGYWLYTVTVSDGFNGQSIVSNGFDTTVSALDTGIRFGTLRFLGGGDYEDLNVPTADTPLINDIFFLYTTAFGDVLSITASDEVGTSFELQLLQQLVHVGPYLLQFDQLFDDSRNTLGCTDPTGTFVGDPNDPNQNNYVKYNVSDECGRMTELTVSSERTAVPVPGTLALLGLGLAGLGAIRRRAR